MAAGADPVRISSKVDVFSTGVAFYQMLYGKKPFGAKASQDDHMTSLSSGRILSVEFPDESTDKEVKKTAPKVSEQAKALIRQMLKHDHHDRPDVLTICKEAYLLQST